MNKILLNRYKFIKKELEELEKEFIEEVYEDNRIEILRKIDLIKWQQWNIKKILEKEKEGKKSNEKVI